MVFNVGRIHSASPKITLIDTFSQRLHLFFPDCHHVLLDVKLSYAVTKIVLEYVSIRDKVNKSKTWLTSNKQLNNACNIHAFQVAYFILVSRPVTQTPNNKVASEV